MCLSSCLVATVLLLALVLQDWLYSTIIMGPLVPPRQSPTFAVALALSLSMFFSHTLTSSLSRFRSLALSSCLLLARALSFSRSLSDLLTLSLSLSLSVSLSLPMQSRPNQTTFSCRAAKSTPTILCPLPVESPTQPLQCTHHISVSLLNQLR